MRPHTPPRRLLHDRRKLVSHDPPKTTANLLNLTGFTAIDQSLLCGGERFLKHNHYHIITGNVRARRGRAFPFQCPCRATPWLYPRLGIVRGTV